MILFSDDPEQRPRLRWPTPLADGRLSQERVDEAVMRQLGLKAALGLHKAEPATGRDGVASAGAPA